MRKGQKSPYTLLTSSKEQLQAFLIVDKSLVCDCSTLSVIPLMLISAFFSFNVQYPTGCSNYFSFLEHILLNTTNKLPASVTTNCTSYFILYSVVWKLCHALHNPGGFAGKIHSYGFGDLTGDEARSDGKRRVITIFYREFTVCSSGLCCWLKCELAFLTDMSLPTRHHKVVWYMTNCQILARIMITANRLVIQ